MASTNIQKNFTSVTYGGATITSVLDIQVSPQTEFERDGSDNDTSFTYIARKAERNNITLVCRDASEIAKVVNKASGAFAWTEAAAQGSAQSFSIANVQFGNYGHNGRWDNLREYSASGEGGAKTGGGVS